jgi:tRNA (cmo5U34)-methyltransferase
VRRGPFIPLTQTLSRSGRGLGRARDGNAVGALKRDALIRWIYDGMVPGGMLIVMEKVLTNSSDMNRYFIEFYYDFKRRNGYSEEEILKKREALENVLIPYRVDENFELFRRNGFPVVETFFQWYNFAGFMAVKQ